MKKEYRRFNGCCNRYLLVVRLTLMCLGFMLIYIPNNTLSAQKNSDFPPCWHKSQKAFSKKKYSDAIKFINECLAKDSTHAGYWMHKAACFRMMGKENFSQAYISYEKVLNLSPNSSSVYNNLFVLAAKQGKWQKGVKYLQKGMKIESHTETRQFFAYKIQVVQTLSLFNIL